MARRMLDNMESDEDDDFVLQRPSSSWSSSSSSFSREDDQDDDHGGVVDAGPTADKTPDRPSSSAAAATTPSTCGTRTTVPNNRSSSLSSSSSRRLRLDPSKAQHWNVNDGPIDITVSSSFRTTPRRLRDDHDHDHHDDQPVFYVSPAEEVLLSGPSSPVSSFSELEQGTLTTEPYYREHGDDVLRNTAATNNNTAHRRRKRATTRDDDDDDDPRRRDRRRHSHHPRRHRDGGGSSRSRFRGRRSYDDREEEEEQKERPSSGRGALRAALALAALVATATLLVATSARPSRATTTPSTSRIGRTSPTVASTDGLTVALLGGDGSSDPGSSYASCPIVARVVADLDDLGDGPEGTLVVTTARDDADDDAPAPDCDRLRRAWSLWRDGPDRAVGLGPGLSLRANDDDDDAYDAYDLVSTRHGVVAHRSLLTRRDVGDECGGLGLSVRATSDTGRPPLTLARDAPSATTTTTTISRSERQCVESVMREVGLTTLPVETKTYVGRTT